MTGESHLAFVHLQLGTIEAIVHLTLEWFDMSTVTRATEFGFNRPIRLTIRVLAESPIELVLKHGVLVPISQLRQDRHSGIQITSTAIGSMMRRSISMLAYHPLDERITWRREVFLPL